MKRTALINLICSLVSSVVLIVGVLLIIILRDASGIEKRKLVISSASATAIYSGEPLSDEQWYMNEGELSEGHVIEVKVTGKQTNVGISENYVSATVRDQNGADVTEKYYNIEYNPGVLNVRARSMVLIADSATKAYDGTPLTCGSYTIESFISLLPTDTLNVTISGEITEVGETKNFITSVVVLNLGNKDVTRNYSIETKDGLLTVTDASVSGDGEGSGSGETSDPGPDPSPEPGTDPSPDPGTNYEPTGQVLFSVTAFSNDTLYLKLKSYGYCNGKNIVEAVEYPYTIEGVGSAYYLPALALANGGASVSVLQINPVGGIFALPYYTTTGGTVGGQSSDTTVVGSANDTYAVRYYNWDNTAGVEIPTAYQSFEEKYAAFVRENYLYVDAETKAFMQQIISDNGFSVTDTNIISKIAKYIKTAARYDETYSDKLDNEENLVIAFLSEYKSGVCRHYAQAATLLFRTLGIPARYTVGFMENVQAGTTTEITDERGHAWVEVYVDKLGWVMVEVTGTPAVGNSIKEINVSPVYTGKVYDGSTLCAIQRVNGFDALGNEGYTYEVVIEGEISGLGIEKSQIVSFTIKDGFGVVVYDEITGVGKDKLKVNYSDGTVQMYISQLSFESYDYSKTYDGTPLYGVLEEIEMISGRLNSRHKCEIKLTKSITVAGKISNEYSVAVYDRSTGVDVTDYYRITKKYGTLTVEARKLTVTAASAEREYIYGASLECKEIYYDQSLLAPGDTLVEYNVQGSQTAIGESANVVRGVVIKNSDGVNVTLSYSITIIDGVLKVTAPKQ